MMTRAYSKPKPMVGTMSRSIAAMSGAWFRRKVPHPAVSIRIGFRYTQGILAQEQGI
jgi:hypothetical protein